MTRTEHLLDILIEECAEVIKRVTKAKRFGMYEVQPGQMLNNSERVIHELNDVVGTANLLLGDEWIDAAAVVAKQNKIAHYLEYSVECGTLVEASLREKSAPSVAETLDCISKARLKDRVEHYKRFLDDHQGMTAARREYYLNRIQIFGELVKGWLDEQTER